MTTTRIIATLIAAAFLSGTVISAQAQTNKSETTKAGKTSSSSYRARSYSSPTIHKPGGFMGFVAGCCFGPRGAADYNEGKKLHWRDWVHLVAAPWAGVEGYLGKTRADYVNQYGSDFF